MQRLSLSSAAVLLGLLFLLPPAWAAVDRDQAASLAQRTTHGRVLAVERGIYLDNSVVWRVTVVDAAGQIRTVEIDAATGRPR